MKKVLPRAIAQANILTKKSAKVLTRAHANLRGRYQIAGGSRLLHKGRASVASAIFTLGLASGTLPAEAADSNDAQVAVSATVLRYASIHVLNVPRTVNISQIDIVQGYVDVPTTSKLEIRANSPTGYVITIDSQAEFARETEVRGVGRFASLGRFGGILNIRTVGHGMQTTPVELSFRILLSRHALPGVYPWSPQISMLPV